VSTKNSIIFNQFFSSKFGLSGGTIPDNSWIGGYSNSYANPGLYLNECWLNGETHTFGLPEGAIRPEKKYNGNVYGCGLILDPDHKMTIFFTLNGQLLGKFLLIY
jgi:hypothetical protein